MNKIINWFEIPVTDLPRATAFYETVFDVKLQPVEAKEVNMAMFPGDMEMTGGALAQSPFHTPSDKGAIVYLNGGDDLSTPLGKVEGAGGKVLVPKTDIGDYGFFAMFADSEGNAIGIHSMG